MENESQSATSRPPQPIQPKLRMDKRKHVKGNGNVCEVQSCRKSRRHTDNIKFFKVPIKADVREAWAKILNITVFKSRMPVICQNHFNPVSICKRRLRVNSLPITSSEAEELRSTNESASQLQKYSSIQSGQCGKIDVVLIPTVSVQAASIETELTDITTATNGEMEDNVDLIAIKTESDPIYICLSNDQNDKRNTSHKDSYEKSDAISAAKTVTDPKQNTTSTCEKKSRLHKRSREIICKVTYCRKSKRENNDLKFYHFPSNTDRRKYWASILNIPDNEVSWNSYVCADHFHPTSIGPKYIKKIALPIYIGPIENNISAATITPTNQTDSIPKSSLNTQLANEQDEAAAGLLPELDAIYVAPLNIEMDNQNNLNGIYEQENECSEKVVDLIETEASALTGTANEISCQKCHKLLMVETVTYSKIIAVEEKHNEHEPIAIKKRETVYRLREQYRKRKLIASRKRRTIRNLRLQLKMERHRYDALINCARKQCAFMFAILQISGEKIAATNEIGSKIKKMLTIRKPANRRKVLEKQFSTVFVVTNS